MNKQLSSLIGLLLSDGSVYMISQKEVTVYNLQTNLNQ